MRRRRSRRRRRGGSGRARAAPLARRGCRRRRARVSQRRSHAPLSRTRRRRARRVRAPWCVSPRRGAAVRDAIKKCLVIRQTSKPLANSQKGFLEAHFNGTALLTSHEVPLIRFHFNTLRLLFCGFASSLSPERTCALSTAASPRSSRGADPGSASRRTLEAHTRGRPRLASGRSRARVGHRELGTRASNGLVRAHGARRSTRSAPPFALRRARDRRLSPWPSTRTRFGSWRTAA